MDQQEWQLRTGNKLKGKTKVKGVIIRLGINSAILWNCTGGMKNKSAKRYFLIWWFYGGGGERAAQLWIELQ